MAIKTLPLVILAIVVALGMGCDSGTGDEQGGASSITAAVWDGEWELRVDRIFDYRPGVDRVPSDALTDADFRPVSGGPTYRVVVSDRGSRVSIDGVFGENLVEGQQTGAVGARTEYDLGESTFAGGRFVVWPAEGGQQAEVAIYGSGMAFVVCARGSLVLLP